MKTILFTISILFLICIFQFKSKKNLQNQNKENRDTIIVKHQNILDKSYEIGFYSKSFSYFWIVEKDTLDFNLTALEYDEDKSISLIVSHQNPMKMKIVLKNIERSLPIIQQDFKIEKLKSLYFTKSFIYYPDIITELSNEYKTKFGQKRTSYSNLKSFLLNSNFNKKIDNFLKSQNKKVINYSIEKFHLIDNESIKNNLPHTDLKNYPENAINGMGISIILQDNK